MSISSGRSDQCDDIDVLIETMSQTCSKLRQSSRGENVEIENKYMLARLKRERIKALTVSYRSQAILAEMEINLQTRELKVELENLIAESKTKIMEVSGRSSSSHQNRKRPRADDGASVDRCSHGTRYNSSRPCTACKKRGSEVRSGSSTNGSSSPIPEKKKYQRIAAPLSTDNSTPTDSREQSVSRSDIVHAGEKKSRTNSAKDSCGNDPPNDEIANKETGEEKQTNSDKDPRKVDNDKKSTVDEIVDANSEGNDDDNDLTMVLTEIPVPQDAEKDDKAKSTVDEIVDENREGNYDDNDLTLVISEIPVSEVAENDNTSVRIEKYFEQAGNLSFVEKMRQQIERVLDAVHNKPHGQIPKASAEKDFIKSTVESEGQKLSDGNDCPQVPEKDLNAVPKKGVSDASKEMYYEEVGDSFVEKMRQQIERVLDAVHNDHGGTSKANEENDLNNSTVTVSQIVDKYAAIPKTTAMSDYQTTWKVVQQRFSTSTPKSETKTNGSTTRNEDSASKKRDSLRGNSPMVNQPLTAHVNLPLPNFDSAFKAKESNGQAKSANASQKSNSSNGGVKKRRNRRSKGSTQKKLVPVDPRLQKINSDENRSYEHEIKNATAKRSLSLKKEICYGSELDKNYTTFLGKQNESFFEEIDNFYGAIKNTQQVSTTVELWHKPQPHKTQ